MITTNRPSKPYPSFPLSAHANGQWYVTRRIAGRKRFFYFGEWEHDRDGRRALAEYQAVAADLAAAREPSRPAPPDLITAAELVGLYLDHQEGRAQGNEISYREFDDVRRATLYDFLNAVGEDTLCRSLTIASRAGGRLLDSFRHQLVERCSVATVNKRLSKVRGMFRWALDRKMITDALHEDVALRALPRKLVRQDRRRRAEANGLAIFTPEECQKLVSGAAAEGPALLSFVLLGLNGGMGQSHVSELPDDGKIVDLAGAFIDWIRTKTEIACQVPLWPITVYAMTAARQQRPKPKPEAARLFFVTRYGNPWVAVVVKDYKGSIGDVNPGDGIGKAFDRLQRRLGIKRPGRGFYALRRTFATIANELQDRDAKRRIMGHELEGMDPHYVLQINRERLAAVVAHVGKRLLGGVDLVSSWPSPAGPSA